MSNNLSSAVKQRRLIDRWHACTRDALNLSLNICDFIDYDLLSRISLVGVVTVTSFLHSAKSSQFLFFAICCGKLKIAANNLKLSQDETET